MLILHFRLVILLDDSLSTAPFLCRADARTFTERYISEYTCFEAELDISGVLEHLSSSHINKTGNLHKFMTLYCLQFVYLIKCGILKI